MNFYNDNDPKACAWLMQLMINFQIPWGTISEKPIQEINEYDINGTTQAHFFAGIGGWPYALQLAGWPANRHVWTGSCPCQPFSAAGKKLGTSDERHLWPEFRRLIDLCRPATIFGEQVASKAGREWINGVRADLEAMEYAVGAADLCAAGVGAPHIRQRLFWVAHANNQRHRAEPDAEARRGEFSRNCKLSWMGDSESIGDRSPSQSNEHSKIKAERGKCKSGRSSPWSDYKIIECRDGKARRIKSGIHPLAYGIPGRVGLLRGYGNAIVPQVAAEFVRAFMESINL